MLALIGIGLVVIAGAVRRDFHPRAMLHVELTDEAGLVIRHLDAVEVAAGHGVVIHVPELRADGHFHLHAVARDIRRARVVNRVAAVEVAIHLHVAFIAAGRQQNALFRLDIDDRAVRLLHADALDALGDGILHEADHLMAVIRLRAAILSRRGKTVPAAAVFKRNAAVLLAEVTRRADEIRAFQLREFDQQGAPAQRAAAGITDFVAHRLQRSLNPLQVGRKLVGQPVEILFRNDLRLVQVAHIGAERLDVVLLHEDDALAGCNRLAARVLFVGLVIDHNVHIRIDFHGLDIRRRARHAVTGDDDVVFLVPLHILRREHPVAGIFVFRLFLFGGSVHQSAGKQADARGAHRRALEEILTGNVLRHCPYPPFETPCKAEIHPSAFLIVMIITLSFVVGQSLF